MTAQTRRSTAPPPGPFSPRDEDRLALGVAGFVWADLFSPARLGDLHATFDAWFRQDAPDAWRAFNAYRESKGDGMSAEQKSEALLAAAPHVGAFVGRLFGVEREVEALRAEVKSRAPIWRFKRDFAKKRVLREVAGKAFSDAASAAGIDAVVTARAIAETAIHAAHAGPVTADDEEAIVASGTLVLVAIDEVARRAARAGGAEWTDALRAEANKIRVALLDNPHTGGALQLLAPMTSAQPTDADLARAVAIALDAIEFHLARRRADSGDAAHRWMSLKKPHDLDWNGLVRLRRPDEALPELIAGPEHERRQRSNFSLTDLRGSARQVEHEIDYCLYCHNRDKDSCSKGLRDKAPGTFKNNPLGVALKGCPLEEKISEMHTMRRDGEVIAALALVAIDNPMLPGTGHRICNDCMKACVFQKQEPVNIPEVETRVLTEVLALPWGVEIYGLLTRWNPLNIQRPHARPYNGKNVMVVGLGPAGYTLAHHLACEGFGVVAVDGLKLEPLPAALTGGRHGGVYLPPAPIARAADLFGALDERIILGFGGVSEYGITVRWDKNFLTLLYMTLARNPHLRMYGGVRFGGTVTIEDAWEMGIDHIAIAAGAGKPTVIDIKNNLARGIRKASDFLMGLQLSGAAKKTSIANLQVSLPAIVIGGGLTAIDTATELLAYYCVQVEKTVARFDALLATKTQVELRAGFDDEEWATLAEHLAHGRALLAEKALAASQQREPRVQQLLDSWGGVTLVYRKGLAESPAYRLNHEEVAKSLEEGVRYLENLAPTEAVLSATGAVAAMKFTRKDGSVIELPARTVCVAAGTSPNIVYEKEHAGSFKLDARAQYFLAHRAVHSEEGVVSVEPVADASEGFFTSYCEGGRTVSFYGDNHPHYAGSVVKAMASAKDGHPYVTRLFPQVACLGTAGQFERDAALTQTFARFDEALTATIVEVNRLTKTIVEVVVKAPLAARKFLPGQFYRLQNFESLAPVVSGTRLAMEGLALTGAWTDHERGLMGTIVLEMGGSSRLCAALEPGEQVVLMGPTGAPTEIGERETVLLCGGGLGNAVLFSIARAFKALGSRIIYFAGYRDGGDVFKIDDIERYSDQVVWATDAGAPVVPRRPQDAHFRGNIVQAMLAFATGQLGVTPVAKLSEVGRIIAIGSDRMMAAVKDARHAALLPYLDPKHLAIASINSPMQCMMKEVCAQCLQRQIDPKTGKETMVFTCFNQDQELDLVDFSHLRARLRANSMQEKLSALWLDNLLAEHPHLIRV